MRWFFSAGLAFSLTAPLVAQQAARPPIIDVHLHAYTPGSWGNRRPPNPVTGQPAPVSAEAHMRATLAAMDRYNIVAGVVSGPLDAVEVWRRAAPGRFFTSPLFGRPRVDDAGIPLPGIDSLRALYRSGKLSAMAEVTTQYEGLSPSDPSMEPFFALAEQLDIPVGIHTGASFPGMPYSGKPEFRLRYGNPLLLEDLLVRHPKLRVYMMHAGGPFREEAMMMMGMYPQLYADVGAVDWVTGPRGRARFQMLLNQMVQAGFGKRIMFGSDQMRWPEAIGMAIDAIESDSGLTADQKRDILYNNAARFLRLSPDQAAQSR